MAAASSGCSLQHSGKSTKMKKDRINYSEYPMLMGRCSFRWHELTEQKSLLSKRNLGQGELHIDPELQLLVYVSTFDYSSWKSGTS